MHRIIADMIKVWHKNIEVYVSKSETERTFDIFLPEEKCTYISLIFQRPIYSAY